jgi:hypothetical protein
VACSFRRTARADAATSRFLSVFRQTVRAARKEATLAPVVRSMRGTSLSLTPSRVLLLLFAHVMLSPWSHPDPARLVLGVQSEPMSGAVSALHVVVRVDGAVVADETVRPPGPSRAGFPQPWEKKLSAPVGDPAARVEVTVEAQGVEGAAPVLTRLASTRFVPGREQLLRVPLEARCVVHPPPPPGSKVPGPLSGPTCIAPSTCILGACRSGFVSPDNLETYAANWPTNAPDRCKPRNAGPPDLQIGTGQSDYLPLASGQTLQAEAGPQGGHHIWIAARMKNVKQALSTTRVEGLQPGTGTPIPPSTFVFNYAPDDGGYCKLYGLRYQLDNGGIDYKPFLGKPLDVRVTVTDPAGTTVTNVAHIQVAPTLVNPR